MIHLEKVTWDNVDDVLDLRVAKEQKEFLASNVESLADAYLELSEGGHVYPFAIYNDKKAVGFIMIKYAHDWSGYEHEAWICSDEYKFYKDKPYYYIWRFMIDKRFQGRGYGREAIRQIIDFVKTFPCGEAEYCVLSYSPTNEVAKKFYESVGFVEINGDGYYEENDERSAVFKLSLGTINKEQK